MPDTDHSARQGRYVIKQFQGETVRAFVPPPLPPVPPVDLARFQILLEQANQAIGRLDGLASLLPDLSLLLYTYVRKEAVLSSQIEGTQSSLSDLLLYENDEAPGAPIEDVQEVSNYVAAMNHGLERMRSGFPLSLRLIREIHEVLLSKGRGSGKQPGEFRRSQNWIGGSRPGNAVFVPPPPELLNDCLNQFELFLHDEQTGLPLLIRAGLIHVQFETIHPFLDGNGRLGRLLITFLLCAKALREPILYLSLYFKTNRAAYYELLDRVRTKGDWEAWLDFFLVGVRTLRNRRPKHLAKFWTFSTGGKRSRHSADQLLRCCAFFSICSETRSLRSRRGKADWHLSPDRRQVTGPHDRPRHPRRDHWPRAAPAFRLPRLPRHPQRRDGATASISN